MTLIVKNDLRRADRHRELFLADRLASAINERDGADLKAIGPDSVADDAVLVSPSKRFLRIPVQIVSLPCDHPDPSVRRDHKNYRQLETALATLLRAAGIHCGDVAISWTKEALKVGPSGMSTPMRALVEMIAFRIATGSDYFTLRAEEVYDEDPSVGELMHYARVFRLPQFPTLHISSHSAFWVPKDGTWIQEAVQKKTAKYSPASCSNVILLVDGALYLDAEQIDAFAAHFNPAVRPFLQLWVSKPNALVRLK